MNARQHPYLTSDLPNLIESPSIRTTPSQQHVVTENLLTEPLECAISEFVARFVILRNRRHDLGLNRIDQAVALALGVLRRVKGVAQSLSILRLDLVVQRLVERGWRYLRLLGVHAFVKFSNRCNDLANFGMRKFQRVYNCILGYFECSGLDH